MYSGLNRREFIALLAAAPLTFGSGYADAADLLPAEPTVAADGKARPWWTQAGVIAASNMETLYFVRRRGGEDADYTDELRAELSEATVRTLLAQGVNILILQFYKGGGLKAEAEDIARARDFVRVAQRWGLRISGYVGGTLLYETLEVEEPRSKDWKQVDEFGHPIYYGEPGQTFRYMACRNNPEYLDYIKRVLRVGLEDLRLDMIHFDQMLWPTSSCHCNSCHQQFREFLKQRYPADRALLRFGFKDVGLLDIPPFGNNSGQNWFGDLTNPLMQDWITFRSWSLGERFKELAEYIRQIKPGTAVLGNPAMNLEENNGYTYGVDYGQLLKGPDMLFSEEPNQPVGWTEDGRLVSQIRTYKGARTIGKSLWVWQSLTREDESPSWGTDAMERGLAEALAYNDRNLGVVAGFDLGTNTIPTEAKPYIDLFNKRAKDLINTRPVADVAVLRSFASSTFSPARAIVATTLFEQSLIVSKIPFAIIFDQHLSDLEAYKVLVLADQEALSDEQIASIRRFVRAGGGVVATGRTSLFTEWRLKRSKFGLADLLGTTKPKYGAPNTPLQTELGAGRAVYIPRIEPSIELQPAQLSYSFPNRYWRLPKNHNALVAAVRWAAREQLSADVIAPDWVTIELAQQETDSLLLHLVNFKPGAKVENIRVTLRPGGKAPIREAMLITPERLAGQALPISHNGDTFTVVVPSMSVYALVHMPFANA